MEHTESLNIHPDLLKDNRFTEFDRVIFIYEGLCCKQLFRIEIIERILRESAERYDFRVYVAKQSPQSVGGEAIFTSITLPKNHKGDTPQQALLDALTQINQTIPR